METCPLQNVKSRQQHSRIKDFRVHHDFELAISSQLHVAHEHVRPRDPVLMEGEVAIILHLPVHFGPNVSHLDSWHWVVKFVPNSHEKGLHSVILALGNESSKNNCVSRKHSELAGPKFIRGYRGRVKDDLVCGGVEGCCCLESCDIRPMAKFGLSVCPVESEMLSILEP